MRKIMTGNTRRKKGPGSRSFFVKAAAVLIALCLIAALALPAFAAQTGGAPSLSGRAALAAAPGSVLAAASGNSAGSQDAPYTYTVRVFPGDKGTINGSTEPFVKKIAGGQYWNASDFRYQDNVQIREGTKYQKYSVTGIRESGKDNNTNRGLYSGSFKVERDIDLVVSYGIRGSEVAYTISYREYGTEKLLDVPEGHTNPETYYGNVGEKPVISYLYIDGYTPQYRNITGTLKENAAENNWTFYYVSNAAPQPTQTPQPTQAPRATTAPQNPQNQQQQGQQGTQTTVAGGQDAGGAGAGAGAGADAGTGTGAGAGADAGTGTGADAGTGAGGTDGADQGAGTQVANADDGTVNTRENGPQEIVDIDEQQTPLAEFDPSTAGDTGVKDGLVRSGGMSDASRVAVAAMAGASLIACLAWLFIRRRREEADESDE